MIEGGGMAVLTSGVVRASCSRYGTFISQAEQIVAYGLNDSHQVPDVAEPRCHYSYIAPLALLLAKLADVPRLSPCPAHRILRRCTPPIPRGGSQRPQLITNNAPSHFRRYPWFWHSNSQVVYDVAKK